MREILVLQLGGFGNKMGLKFWEELYQDTDFSMNNVESNPLKETENVVYYNLNEKKPLPRCVQVDLGRDIPLSQLDFNPCNQFSFNYSSGNNFAFVQNHCNSEVCDIIMDSIRSEVESCDSLQGFQFFHSIIGGTGSGLASILCQKVNDEYSSSIIQSNILLPSKSLNDSCVVYPYNSVLSFNSIFEQVSQFIFFDNDGLEYNLKRLGEKHFDYDDMNKLVAQTICCNSSPFRRAGDLNSSLRKLISNMIPFSRLRLHTCAVTNNQMSEHFKQYLKMDETQVLKEIMSNNHFLINNDLSKGKLITAALSLRGNISNQVIDKEKFQLEMFFQYFQYYSNRQKKKLEWLNLFFTNICKKQYSNYEYFGSSIINTTSIVDNLTNMQEKFEKLVVKKSYMHKYCEEGLEQCDFDSAKISIQDLTREYEDLNSSGSGCGENNEMYE